MWMFFFFFLGFMVDWVCECEFKDLNFGNLLKDLFCVWMMGEIAGLEIRWMCFGGCYLFAGLVSQMHDL